MSSIAPTTVGDRAPFQRFAFGFGRASAVLSALALLVAVGMSVPTSWFSFLGRRAGRRTVVRRAQPSAPVRLAMAGVDVVTPLVATDLDPRSTLANPPADAPLVTWWSGSAEPGAAQGQTVLTGHATEAGGALSPIAKLDKGDFVDLLTRQGTMRYEVDSVRTFDPATMERAAHHALQAGRRRRPAGDGLRRGLGRRRLPALGRGHRGAARRAHQLSPPWGEIPAPGSGTGHTCPQQTPRPTPRPRSTPRSGPSWTPSSSATGSYRSGIAAEETIQLPPRGDRNIEKAEARERDDIRRGRALRHSHRRKGKAS